ncbi:hypothetical protein yberc0001_23700 [Yersinia bercovieri ATCC 43970]|uniref:Uncharacterized protein n=1 Tax=Yersinia bercovieri ATCC 43970 TaxID=349968 RepID=A0ABM9Y2A9_YERBE|nr:hypothetical protein yberc0001_23700 [Yersinia bercovieri ATCC 43970]
MACNDKVDILATGSGRGRLFNGNAKFLAIFANVQMST